MHKIYTTLLATVLALTTTAGCGQNTELIGKIEGHSFSNRNGCTSAKRLDIETKDNKKAALCYEISECAFEDHYYNGTHEGCGLSCGGPLHKKSYRFIVSSVTEDGSQKLVLPIGEEDSTPSIPLYELVEIEDTFDYPERIDKIGSIKEYSEVGYEAEIDGLDRKLMVKTDKKLGGWGIVHLVLEKTLDKNLTGRPIYEAKELSLLDTF